MSAFSGVFSGISKVKPRGQFQYLTSGPGHYALRLDSMRMVPRKGKQNHLQLAVSMTVLAVVGEQSGSTFKPGDDVSLALDTMADHDYFQRDLSALVLGFTGVKLNEYSEEEAQKMLEDAVSEKQTLAGFFAEVRMVGKPAANGKKDERGNPIVYYNPAWRGHLSGTQVMELMLKHDKGQELIDRLFPNNALVNLVAEEQAQAK